MRRLEPHQELYYRIGVPVPDEGDDPREYVIGLLQIAAEVEHALMVQYLYATASLTRPPDAAPGSEPITNFRQKVRNVAVQEMGHLATVQNLLLLTGGPDAIHLQRDVRRASSKLNPMPFVLEPVGLPALAKFVVAEMPASVPAEQVELVASLLKIARKSSKAALHRVGAIYAAIRWIFLPKSEADAWLDLVGVAGYPPDFHLDDSDLTPSATMDSHEARGDEWGAAASDFILETPRTCVEAADSIEKISRQGEGWDNERDSHFAEFLELVIALKRGELNAIMRPIAEGPTLGGGHGSERGRPITDPYARAWGEVFSLQYTLLVLSIGHAFVTRRSVDGELGLRSSLVDLALQSMVQCILPLSELLAGLSLRTGETAPAGPPYDLDPAALEPAAPDVLRARHFDRLDRLAELYAVIETSPEFAMAHGHDDALVGLRSFDQLRRDLFARALAIDA